MATQNNIVIRQMNECKLKELSDDILDLSNNVNELLKDYSDLSANVNTNNLRANHVYYPTQWKTDFLPSSGVTEEALDVVDKTGWYSNHLGVQNNRYNPKEWKICRDNIKQLGCFKNIPLPHTTRAVSYHPISDDKYIYVILTWDDDIGTFTDHVKQFLSRSKMVAGTWVAVSSGYHGFGTFGAIAKLDRFTGELLNYQTMNQMTGVLPDINNPLFYARTGDSAIRGNIFAYGDHLYLPSASLGYASITKVKKSDLTKVARVEIANVNNINDQWDSLQTIPYNNVNYKAIFADKLTKELIVVPPKSGAQGNRGLYPLVVVGLSSHLQYEFGAPGFENLTSKFTDAGKVMAYYDKGSSFEKAWEFSFAPNQIKTGDKFSQLSLPFENTFDVNTQKFVRGNRKTSMRIHYPISAITKSGDYPNEHFNQDKVVKVPVYNELDDALIALGDTVEWGYINLEITVTVNNDVETLVTTPNAGFNKNAIYPVWVTENDARTASVNRKPVNNPLLIRNRPGYVDSTPQYLNYNTGGIIGGSSKGTDANTTGSRVSGLYLFNFSAVAIRVLYATGVNIKVLDQYEAYGLNYWGAGCWGSLAYDEITDIVYVPTANGQYMPLEEMEMYRELPNVMNNVLNPYYNHPDPNYSTGETQYYKSVSDELLALGLVNGQIAKSSSNYYSDKSGPTPGMLTSSEELTLCGLKLFPAKFELETNQQSVRYNKAKFDSSNLLVRKGVLNNTEFATAKKACIRLHKSMDLAVDFSDMLSERSRRFLVGSNIALNCTTGDLKWFKRPNPHDIFADHVPQNTVGRLMRPIRGNNADFVAGVIINNTKVQYNSTNVNSARRVGVTGNKRSQHYYFDLDGIGSITVPTVNGVQSTQANDGIISVTDPFITPMVANNTPNTNYNNGIWNMSLPSILGDGTVAGPVWGSIANDGASSYVLNVNNLGFYFNGVLTFEDIDNVYNIFKPVNNTDLAATAFVNIINASPQPYFARARVMSILTSGSLSEVNKQWCEGTLANGAGDVANMNPLLLNLQTGNKRGRINPITKINNKTGNPIFEIMRETGYNYRTSGTGYAITLLNDLLIHGSICGDLRFYDTRDGALVHTYYSPEGINAGVPVCGGVIYLQAGYNKFFSSNATSNKFLKLLTIDGI